MKSHSLFRWFIVVGLFAISFGMLTFTGPEIVLLVGILVLGTALEETLSLLLGFDNSLRIAVIMCIILSVAIIFLVSTFGP